MTANGNQCGRKALAVSAIVRDLTPNCDDCDASTQWANYKKERQVLVFFFTLLRLSCVLCAEPISDGAKNFSSGVHKPNAVAVGIEKDGATTCLSLRESDGCGWMVHYLGEA